MLNSNHPSRAANSNQRMALELESGMELELSTICDYTFPENESHCWQEQQNSDTICNPTSAPFSAASSVSIAPASRAKRIQCYQVLTNSNREMPFSLKPVLEIETSKWWSWLRWRTFDHIIQKNFYFPFVDARGFIMFGIVSNHPLYHRVSRFRWIRGQAIPIRCLGTLRKALWADGFRVGLEVAILAPIHLGLLALTLYHAFDILNPVVYCSSVSYLHPSFMDFINKIGNSDRDSLAGAFRSGLKVTLSPQMIVFFIPVAWGIINGFIRATINVGNGNEGFSIGVKRMHLFKDNFWNNWMSGFIPLHPLSREFTGILKRFLWDGRLSNASREQAFQTFCSMIERSGFAKMMGFEALTQVLYSCHVDDLMFLQDHDAIPPQDAKQWFSMKSRAVEALMEQGRWKGWNQLLYCLYCRYLLWSVGLSMSWGDRIGWIVFKGGKLYTQVELMILIVENIISALDCPSPGSYTITGPTAAAGRPSESCLNAYISNFGIIPGQNVSVITDNMGRFYLDSCRYTIDLSNKLMTPDQVGPLISSFVNNQPDVTLVSLKLKGNQLDDVPFFDNTLSLLTGLEYLDLSLNSLGTLGSNGTVALGRGLSHLRSLKALLLAGNSLGKFSTAGVQAIGAGLKFLTGLTLLDLSANELGAVGFNGVLTIQDSLSALTNLTNLNLNSCTMEKHGAVSIETALPSLVRLTSLDLSANFIGYSNHLSEVSLGLGLKYLTNLSYLALSANYIGKHNSIGETVICESLGYLQSLTYLNLNSNSLGSVDSNGTVAFGKSLQKLTSLQYLYLSSNSIGFTDSRGEQAIGYGLSKIHSIVSLDLDSNSLFSTDSQGLGGLAMGLGLSSQYNMGKLLLGANSLGMVDDSGAIAIGNAFKTMTALTILFLGSNYIGDRGAEAIATGIKYCKNLQKFYFLSQLVPTAMKSVDVMNAALMQLPMITPKYYLYPELQTIEDVQDYFSSGLPISVTDISLSDGQIVCPADPVEARFYGDAIMKGLTRFPNLASIKISGNALESGNSNLTQAIGDGLRYLASTLTSLELSFASIGSFDDSGLESIGKGMKTISKLQSFIFRANDLSGSYGDRGYTAFFEGLSTLTALITLKISYNNMGANSVLPVAAAAKALQHLTAVQVLELSQNMLENQDSSGIVSIANAISKMTALGNLMMSDNMIGSKNDAGETAIGNALKSLSALNRIDLADNFLGSTSVHGVFEITNSLQYLSNLVTLLLSVNRIGIHGSEAEVALGNSLMIITQLRYLDITAAKIGVTGPAGPLAIMNGLAKLEFVASNSLFVVGITNVTLPQENFAPLVCAYNQALSGSCNEGMCYGDVKNVSQNAFADVPPYLYIIPQSVASGSVTYAPGYKPEVFSLHVDCGTHVVANSGSRSKPLPFWMDAWNWVKNDLMDAITNGIVNHCCEVVKACPSYFSGGVSGGGAVEIQQQGSHFAQCYRVSSTTASNYNIQHRFQMNINY